MIEGWVVLPKARDPNRDKAYEIYKHSEGFIDLVEIASQLNLPPGTIRGWKSKDKWDDKMNGTFQTDTERSNNNRNDTYKPNQKEVNKVLNNPELNDKQRLFCLYYIKCFNATKAYKKAYEGCSDDTAMVNGCKLLSNAKIKEQIISLKQGKLNQSFLEQSDIFQKYMDIAFSDITDYVTFGKREVTLSDKEGREATIEQSYVDVNESWMVDGTLINEISQGREGIKVKLADRMKALNWLAEHMDMATEEQKAKVSLIKAQTDKLTGNNQEIEDLSDTDGDIYGD